MSKPDIHITEIIVDGDFFEGEFIVANNGDIYTLTHVPSGLVELGFTEDELRRVRNAINIILPPEAVNYSCSTKGCEPVF